MKKIVLITGASSGLGKKIAEELLQSNKYKVYSISRNQGDTPKDALFYKADITKDSDCSSVVSEILRKEGRVDVLVNNAGVTLSGPTSEFSPEDLSQIINLNTVGPFRLIRKVIPAMKKNRWGRIINITSLNGIVSLPNFGLYSASKHALEALGQALGYELAKDGIFVTNIAPGAILSEGNSAKKFPHKPAREKFKILYLIMPMLGAGEVARGVIKIIELPKPPLRLVMGKDAQVTFFLQRFMPSFIWEKLMMYVWNKK